MSRPGRLVTAVVAAAVLVACADLHLDPAVSYIDTPIADPSWAFDIYPVLAVTCASSSACHFGPNPTTGLNLASADTAYANLVNHQSFSRPGILRVKPGNPDSSFFYAVLHDTASLRFNYPYRMPLTPNPLPFATRETIKNWITKGAKNN